MHLCCILFHHKIIVEVLSLFSSQVLNAVATITSDFCCDETEPVDMESGASLLHSVSSQDYC